MGLGPETLTHLKWLPVLVGGGSGGGRAIFCVPAQEERARQLLLKPLLGPQDSECQGPKTAPPRPQPQALPGLFWKLLDEARLAPWADVILWEWQGQSGYPFQATYGSSV